MIEVAFYKGRGRLLDKAIQWWTKGPYSHVEIVIDGLWYASSPHDGGVRVIAVEHDPSKWDMIRLDVDSQQVIDYFTTRVGIKYDYLGALGFVLRILGNDTKRLFCSEVAAGAIGLQEGWRFDPNTLAVVVRLMAAKS